MARFASLFLLLLPPLTTLAGEADAGTKPATPKVDFNRDVQPILADKCLNCHGRDAKHVEAELRLDLRDSATGDRGGYEPAIVPGKPQQSTLVARIHATDEAELMPPPESQKVLSSAEKKTLEQWIAEGAEYQDHWAFIKPTRPPLPEVKNMKWAANELDRFILARLEAAGMQPSPEASRETLTRRVSLDLRGFPPSLDEVKQFLDDDSPQAYERMVDRMLASEHYGEKMARIWMDLARYGDTNGFHYDSTRQAWMWRDWVIDAYNQNMPYDRFTIEQLAGDLLPDATTASKIASGFNRNSRYNEEGGADPDEWRVEYAKDRTRTLGQVWLGLTLGCADCHSHKYDPISQTEFYQLYAFFNSLDEPGAQGHRQKYPPFVTVPSEEQQATIAQAEVDIARLRKEIQAALAAIEYSEPTDLADEPEAMSVDVLWIDDDAPTGANLQGHGEKPWNWVTAAEHPVHRGERATYRSGDGLNQHYFTGAKEPLQIEAGDVLFAYVWLDPKNPPKTVQLQFNDGSWEHRAHWGEDRAYGGAQEGPQRHRVGDLPKTGEWVRLEVPAADVGLKPGAKLNGWAFSQVDGAVVYDAAGVSRRQPDTRHLRSLALWEKKATKDNAVPDNVRKAIAVATEKRNEQQTNTIRDYYVEHVFAETRKVFDPLHKLLAKTEKLLNDTKEAVPFQIVSVEMDKPRPAYLLMRGDFLKPADQVQRDVPSAFPSLPEDQPRNRLGLAHWLFDEDHPLTARVVVNRYWAQLFGRGIVETIGDFGHLGRFPTHPELLDWLAVEFVESGWDTKHVMKRMLMSAAYRQSSANDHRYDELDPDNRLLWRSPRFRLPAEEIRDTALSVAGVLSPKIGGPPVFPYQPKDYYVGKKGGWEWKLSQGEDRFRRGMYTFWRRTTPYPTFIIFDAPDRSDCTVERARTNTPLQALVTMNDPQFVEAARIFAERIMREGPADVAGRIDFAFRAAVVRRPSDTESNVLQRLFDSRLKYYQDNNEAAAQVNSAGDYPTAQDLDAAELAAWTVVASTLMNLDETITRE